MAVAIENSYSTGTAGASSLTQSITVNASTDVIIVVISPNYGASGYTSGVTYNSVAMTMIDELQPAFDAGDVSIWKLTSPDTGTHDVVASFVSSTRATHMGVYVLTGVNSSDVNGTASKNANTGTTVSTSVTTGVDGSIVIDGASSGTGSGTWTATGDQAIMGQSNAQVSGYKIKSPAGSVSVAYSFTSSLTLGVMAIEIKATATASTPKPSTQLPLTGVGT